MSINIDQQTKDNVTTKVHTLRYPFDHIEKGRLLPEIMLDARHTHFSTDFLRNQQSTHYHCSSLHNAAKPIAWLFYTPSKYHLEKQIQFLQDLQADARIMKGELLIISAAPLSFWRRILIPGHTLNIYYDFGNALSEQLGLIDHNNPVWKWMSGIDENTPFPCLLVVSSNRQIRFSYVDSDFNMYNPGKTQNAYRRELLTSIYQASREDIAAKNSKS